MKRPLTTPAKKSLGKYKQPAELRLWLRFWTGAGVTLYDFSRYGNNGTINGATWTKDGGLTVLSFDGVDDYVEVPIFPLTDKVTVSAWAYRIGGQPPGSWAGIITNLNGAGNTNRLLTVSSSIQVQIGVGGTDYTHTKTGLPSLNYIWRHYAVTYDGSVVKIFLDGVEVYSGSQTGSLDSGTYKPTIGWGSTLVNYYHLNGLISEVRTYSRALSIEESRALYLGLI
jgi:hypothetical protein